MSPRKRKAEGASAAVPSADVSPQPAPAADSSAAAGTNEPNEANQGAGAAPARSYKRKLGPEEFWPACVAYGISPVTRFYLYRLWPVIDRSLVGIKNSYIDVIRGKAGASFGPSEILRRYGSGKYQVSFNDPNKKPDTRVHVCELELSDPEQPPVLDPSELVSGHPDNRGYEEGLKNKGLLRSESEDQDMGDSAKELAGVAKEALNMARDAGGGADKEIDRALRLAEALRPKSDGSADLLKVLLDNQTKLTAALLDSRNRTPAAPAAENPLASIDSVLGLFDKLGVRFNRGGGESGRSWVEMLPEIMQSGAAMLQGLALMRGMPAAVSPTSAGASVPVAGAVVPVGTDAAAAAQGENMLNPVKLAAVGRKAVAAFQRGVSGDDFAAGLVAFEDQGEKLYLTLAGLGLDQIMGFIRMAPQWPDLAARESEISQWVSDFLSYGAGEEGAVEGGPQ